MDEKKFKYSYVAPTQNERREIEDIKRRYGEEPREKSKIERLRELDGKVKRTPAIWSLSLGVIGTLVFGLGLTMILKWKILVWGIVVMLAACAPIAAAYPVYNAVFSRNKAKYGAEIVKLSDELLNVANEETDKKDENENIERL